MSMIVNRRDLDFMMYEVFDLEQILASNRYQDYDRETISALLDAAQTLAEEKFLPCAARLDANEPTFDGNKVYLIDEVKEALDAFRDAGFFAAGFDADLGGLQLPWVVNQLIGGLFSCANTSISNYSFLTAAAANMLNICGNESQKAVYLPPMIEGRWFGTMCLSEPQAGSSLADIRTKASLTDDGHYLISGNKMWISGGEQEISENIVHMVLARIPGSPPGVRGISLFLVPKYRVRPDGTVGEKNNIALAGLNHKMGHRGTTNTLLNFGESGECHGLLLGKPNHGLAGMFHMMNEARIGIGVGAVSAALGGYLFSLDYARNRPQGRPPGNKDPSLPPRMIAEHADVKRLLMTQKVFVEGGLALVCYCALLIDQQKTQDELSAQNELLLEILTPIAKSWPSEFCLEANKLAIQVLGGYGYTTEYPVERFYRDNRLNPIHEGTHAIHGIDILGRKVRMQDGAALQALIDAMQLDIKQAQQSGNSDLSGFARQLTDQIENLKTTTAAVLACSDLELSLANATLYLDASGHIVIAWMWLKQALAVHAASSVAAPVDDDFYAGKLAACRFFYAYELPKVTAQLALVASLDDTLMSINAEQFVGV